MKKSEKKIVLKPIGWIRTKAPEIPRHWSVSKAEGRLVIYKKFQDGLKDIKPGQRIVVIFHFHKSRPFSGHNLIQTPPHGLRKNRGVFSTCSPLRPNPLGMSMLRVLSAKGNTIAVRGIDTLDGTPLLDIKPQVK